MKDMKNTTNGDRGECNEDSSLGPLRADPGLDHCLELSVKCELHLAAVRWLVTGVRLRCATHIHTTAQQPVKLRGQTCSLLMDTTSWDNIESTLLKGTNNKEMCKIKSAVLDVYSEFWSPAWWRSTSNTHMSAVQISWQWKNLDDILHLPCIVWTQRIAGITICILGHSDWSQADTAPPADSLAWE